jgi:predicted glycosyltransferase
MRVLVDVGHPGHVHFYRHAVASLRAEGHEVVLSARDKDVTLDLLRGFSLEHVVLSSARHGLVREYPRRLFALVKLIRRFRPDVVTAVGGAFVAPAGRLTSTPTVVFTDTEHVAADRVLTYPWATRICTPTAFKKSLPRAHHRYSGLHELAYLHPARFVPDPAVRDEMGIGPEEPFAVVRLVSWRAAHDRGHRGLGPEDVARAVAALGALGRVFVSAEGAPPPSLDAPPLPVAPHRVHHALALARVYLGEGATMATEAGLLGTPSVYVSTLVGTMGNFEMLEKEGLVRSFRAGPPAVEEAARLMSDAGAGPAWRARARSFIARQQDTTEVIRRHLLEVGTVGRLPGFDGAARARP